MKERYTPVGTDGEYVVVDTVTGRPITKLAGFDYPHPTRDAAAEDAERLNRAYERATSE